MQDRKIFIDTHVHTIHSELDGMCKLEDYVDYGKRNNFPALFVSDHGNISCWIPFYLQCKEAGIKPVLGSEVYISEGLVCESEETDKELKLQKENKLNFHLCLYAKDLTGYKNLIKLTTYANMQNFYRKPRITFDILKKYSKGLICSTACVGSIFAYYLLKDEDNKAIGYIKQLQDLFKDDFYIEYGYHHFESEKKYLEKLRRIAKDLNIKEIVANDTHYMYKEDELAHKILMCKGDKKLLDESGFDYSNNYYKSYTEINETFSDFGWFNLDKYMSNTFEIINKVENYEIPLGKYIYPELKNKEGLSQEELLSKNIKTGLVKRYGNNISKNVIDRTKYELDIIKKMNFSGYFNVVQDYIVWCKNNGIPVGPARGCLTGDTKVLVKNGVKELKDIKIGDEVLTHDNTYNKVSKTHCYDCDEDLLEIKAYGSSSFLPKMTTDHKILVVKNPFKDLIVRDKRGYYYSNVKKHINRLSPDKIEWIKARELEKGDYVVRPNSSRFTNNLTEIDLTKYIDEKSEVNDTSIIENDSANKFTKSRIQTLPKKLKIDNDLMYLIGYFIGDGWVSEKGYITFACNKFTDLDTLNKIYEYFGKMDIRVNHKQDCKKNVYQVSVYSRIIFRLFKNIIPKYAKNKLIPEFCLGQSTDLLQSLFKGLIDSDGSRSGNRICYDSINLSLISQVRYLAELLGYTTSITKRKARIDKRGFNNSESYKLEISENKNNFGIFYNDSIYTYCRVKEIKTVKNEENKVYDITVENNHNYCTLDFIVHNSGSGSIVNYILGITEVDPLKYDLIFERFLNPERLNFPDIDSDIEPKGRKVLVNHLIEKYGQNGCVSISTRGFLKGKSSIKVVASKLGLDFVKYNKLLSGIKDPSIDTVDKVVNSSEELTKLYKTDEEFKKVIDIAKKIEGSIQSISVHASAVCLETNDISDYVPIIRTKDGYATGWTDKIVEKCGLIKYDILGLNNLTVIDECCKLIGNNFDIKDIPLDDKKTFKDLQDGDNLGKFQIESSGMKNLLKRLQPENIDHISAILALYRPSSIQFIDEYIKCKKDPSKVKYIDDRIKPILEKTYGQMLYQEQVMSISRVLAGYTMAEADSLRRSIGKKIMSEMLQHESKFIEGCVNNGVKREVAEKLYSQIVEFARYSFNLSHSVAYSFITYQTAYLKSNYPLQFMCALLNHNSDDLDKLNLYIGEVLRLGINILPPDVNISTDKFVINEEGAIIFGLNAIKGLGKTAVNQIIKERKNGEFKSITDFIERTTKVDKSNIQALLRVGAFNTVEKNPKRWDKLVEYLTDAKNSKYYQNGNKLEDSIYTVVGIKLARKSDKYLELVSLKRGLSSTKKDKLLKDEYTLKQNNIVKNGIESVQKHYLQFTTYVPSEKISNEQELLGFNISTNPYKRWNNFKKYFIGDNKSNIKYVEMNDLFENSDNYINLPKFTTVGLLSNIKEIKTKKGGRMAKLTLEYYGVKTDITVFPKQWENNIEFKIQKGNLLMVVGRLVETNKQYSTEDYEIRLDSLRQLNVLVNENNKCIIDLVGKNVEDVNMTIKRYTLNERQENLPVERVVMLKYSNGYKILNGLHWVNNPEGLAKSL